MSLRAKLFLLFFAAIILTGEPACAAEWNLVWSDEFDGAAIDTGKWTHEVNAWGGGNNELQYYTARPENSFLRNGSLVIRAIKETYTGPEGTREYTSARMNSKYKGDWLYGRVEARARVPGGQGLWPAIWMMPTDSVYGGWAASGEIDIMEHRGDIPDRIYGTLHYGGEWPNNTNSGDIYEGPDFTQDFHEYTMEWEPGVFRWYIDGALYQTQTSWWSANGTFPAPFDQRFHLILNLAVGGGFLPDPPPDADYFPREFEIDYVRVYQRATLQEPFGGSPVLLPGRVEAEDFDLGGPEIAYHDEEPSNLGGQYREPEGVDIEATTDAGGGYNVGWIRTGEWMEYMVHVDQAGRCRFDARLAALDQTGRFRLRLLSGTADVDLGAVQFPPTGGWQNWTTVQAGEAVVQPGDYVLRFEAESLDFNVNYFDVTLIEPVNNIAGWILF